MDVTASKPSPIDRDLLLAFLFWAFSYALLSVWGAIVAGDWSVVLSERRVALVTLGASAYWLVLKRLRRDGDVSLRTAAGWIVAGGVTLLLARIGLDELFNHPVAVDKSVRWSLAWSGYFGIWVIGSIAHGRAINGSKGTAESSVADVGDEYWQALFDRVP